MFCRSHASVHRHPNFGKYRKRWRKSWPKRSTGAGSGCPEQYVSGGLTVDFDKRLVRVDGKDIHLTQIEYKIVAFLARNPGRVMTYDAIMNHVWGPYLTADNKILRVNMANIRRKLDKNPAEPQYIQTEIGVGYRIAEEDI